MKTLSKFRSLALSAALLTGVGMTNAVEAMPMPLQRSVELANIDRLGDAGLFQYYTVNNGWQTFFRIINTSDEAVSVKVRFHEAANSREVLDFTIFLSAYDMWTGWTDANALGNGTPGIRTRDNSCLMPAPGNNVVGEGFQEVPGVEGALGADFQDRAFTGDYFDGNSNVAARLKEGHMEVIGIATHGTSSPFALAVLHDANGVPNNCPAARTLFINNSGGLYADGDFFRRGDLGNVLGFNGYLINSRNGMGGGYNPDVLANFASHSLVSEVNSTDVEANLDSGNYYGYGEAPLFGTPEAYLERDKQQGILMNTGAPDFNDGVQAVRGGVDAVSALFMRNTVINEWAADASGSDITGNTTQWVLTFPTKNYYVDLQNDPIITDDISPTLVASDHDGEYDAYAPFSNVFQEYDEVEDGDDVLARGQSCESFIMTLWNREEGSSTFTSPGPSDIPQLCNETNVLTFDDENNINGLKSNFGVSVPPSAFPATDTKGWAKIEWTGDAATTEGLTRYDDGEAVETMYGLPVTGFMFTVYNTVEGATKNHAAINEHKYTREFGFDYDFPWYPWYPIIPLEVEPEL